MLDRIRPRRTREFRDRARSHHGGQREGAFGLGALLLLVLGVSLPASLLAGGSAVSLSAPSPVAVPLGSSTALPGTSLSGFPALQVVRVVFSASSGFLWLPGPSTGLAVPVGYPDFGIPSPTVAYEGTEDDLNAALANLRWTPAEGGPATIKVDAALGGPSYDPTSGHHYQVVDSSDITWDDARLAAEGMSFNGLPGYLATLMSAHEANLVAQTTTGASWIGATDRGTEGTWKWVTGPEAGTSFWDPSCGLGLQGDCAGLGFSNWSAGEPTDAGGNQDVALFDEPDGSGLWIDRRGDAASSPSAFLVEFGGTGQTPTYEGHASTEVTAITVPSAPGAATASAADDSATVSWTAPTSDGWSAVTSYTVTGTPAGSCSTAAPQTSCTITGLTPGTGYTFQVTATNSVGDGPASAPTPVVTPRTPEPVTTPTTAPPPPTVTTPVETTEPSPVDTAGESATGTTTPLDPSSGGSGQVSPSPEEPSLHVVFDVGVGVDAAGARLTVRGAGLDSGAATTITVHSDPIILDTVVPDAQGALSHDVFLPAGLEDGEHVIVGHGKSAGGADVYRVMAFAVEGGKLARIGVRQAPTPGSVVEDTASSSAGATGAVIEPTPSGGGSKVPVKLLALLLVAAGGAAFVVRRRRQATSVTEGPPNRLAGAGSAPTALRRHHPRPPRSLRRPRTRSQQA